MCTTEHLRAGPDLTTILAQVHCAVHRLHHRVREEWDLVNRFHFGGGVCEGLGEVTFRARDRAGLLRGCIHIAHDVNSGELGVAAVVPLDIECGEALLRGPHMVGDDGYSIIQLHHLTNAWIAIALPASTLRNRPP